MAIISTYLDNLDQAASRQETEISLRRAGEPLRFPESFELGKTSDRRHFMEIGILEEARAGSSVSTGSGSGSVVQRIFLYMPNTLQFTTNNQYEDISLTSLGIGLITGPFKDLGALASTATTLTKVLDRPINPKTEVIFSNVALRTFQFEFLFAPTTQTETSVLRNIVKELRRAAAPNEQEGSATLLWIPPQKLRIKFYFNSGNGITQENPWLPKLKDAVIESLDIDYAPTGIYSTFKNGHPVSARMLLRIKEDEIISKKDVDREYSGGGQAG